MRDKALGYTEPGFEMKYALRANINNERDQVKLLYLIVDFLKLPDHLKLEILSIRQFEGQILKMLEWIEKPRKVIDSQSSQGAKPKTVSDWYNSISSISGRDSEVNELE